MEILEKVIDVVPIIGDRKGVDVEKPEGRAYRGLELIEDKPYAGPTSIRYWM